MPNQHKNAVRKLFDRVRGQDRSGSVSHVLDTVEIDEFDENSSNYDGRKESKVLRNRIAEKISQFEKE